MKTRKQNLDTDIASHNIKRSHGISQSRQPGKKPCPVIAKIVQYNNRNKIFRNKKKNFKVKKKKSISKSVTASRMEKLKAQELHGSGNVWTNNGEIFCKLEGNDKPQLFYG